MTLNEWYDKGLTPDKYMGTLDKHKEAFMHIYNEFKLPRTDQAFFTSLKERKLRVVVIAEPWCGHCMLTIPVLLHLAIETATPIRFLLRDENLELMDQHLTSGKSRSVPIFLFINEDGDIVNKWGPFSEITKQYSEALKAKLPSKEADDYEAKFQEAIAKLSKDFRSDTALWVGTYKSIKEELQK